MEENSDIPVRYKLLNSEDWITIPNIRRRRRAPGANGVKVNDGDCLGFQIQGINPSVFSRDTPSSVLIINSVDDTVTLTSKPISTMAFLIQVDTGTYWAETGVEFRGVNRNYHEV